MSEKAITEEKQACSNEPRRNCLNGVVTEAFNQGYSSEAIGRLIVLALRAWERR